MGSGYRPILWVIAWPIIVFSANHLPVAPATGCQPSSMVRCSPLISAESGGIWFGLWPKPSECWRSRCASFASFLVFVIPSLLCGMRTVAVWALERSAALKHTYKNVVILVPVDDFLSLSFSPLVFSLDPSLESSFESSFDSFFDSLLRYCILRDLMRKRKKRHNINRLVRCRSRAPELRQMHESLELPLGSWKHEVNTCSRRLPSSMISETNTGTLRGSIYLIVFAMPLRLSKSVCDSCYSNHAFRDSSNLCVKIPHVMRVDYPSPCRSRIAAETCSFYTLPKSRPRFQRDRAKLLTTIAVQPKRAFLHRLLQLCDLLIELHCKLLSKLYCS